MWFPILFLLILCRANTLNINVAYDIIKPALEYYNSHSVLLIFDEPHNDLFNLLTLQKRLSWANNFYYSTITTRSVLLKALENYRQSPRETVVIWNPNENFPHVLEEFSNDIDFTTHKWFVATSSLTSEAFNNVTIPLHSEFTIAKGNPQSGYSLEEIYDVTPGVRLSNSLGRWLFNTQKFQIHASTYMFNRRKDFQGVTLKVASPIEDDCDPFSLLLKTTALVVCINKRIWYIMEKKFNISTEKQAVPDLNEGTIQNGYFDLTFRSVTTTSDLLNTRDYVWPIFSTRVHVATSFITQKVRWETFVSPFTKKMWIVIVMWIVLWDFILAFFCFIKKAKQKRNSLCCHFNEFSFSTMFSFCGQGIFWLSKSLSTRIILLLTFIVPGVLFPGYSAVLKSFLTVQLDKKPFRNLEEFSNNREYKLGWNKAFQAEKFLDLKTASINVEFLKKVNEAKKHLAESDMEGIERMCNEKYSYVTIRGVILFNKPKCKYYLFDQHVTIFSISMELKKGSWYKYYLDRCLRTVSYSGIRVKMLRQIASEFAAHSNPITTATDFDKSGVPPIKMENIILPFVVLILGVIVSVIVLLLEIVFYRLKSKPSHKSTPLSSTFTSL